MLGMLIAIAAGAIAGIREYVAMAGGPDASSRARVYAESIAVALNCTLLLALFCVPIVVVVQVVRHRVMRRGAAGPQDR
jgi:hypothetical protein